MTGKRNRCFGLLLLMFSAVLFLSKPDLMLQAVSDGLQVCARSILPSLFPFFVLSELWIRLGYAQILSQFLEPVMRTVFHLPGQAASALLLGAIGGYPVGARTVAQLHESGRLTASQAQQSLLFCNNCGPAFAIGVVGAGVFGSVRAGILLYGIHLLSALLLGFFLRPKARPTECLQQSISTDETTAQTVTEAISQAGDTALRVCTFVLFFSVITASVRSLLPFDGWSSLLLGSLELAGGVRQLHLLPVSPTVRFMAASFLIGCGGLCVLLQSLSFLHRVGLNGKSLFAGKLLHGLLSAVLTFLLAPIFPIPVVCSTTIKPGIGPQWSMVLLIFIIFTVFLKKTSGKRTGYPL